MGVFFPLLVFVMFTGIFAIEKMQIYKSTPTTLEQTAQSSAAMFISYCGAVANYQTQHPTFLGTVTSDKLISQGNQFSSNFLGLVGNQITQVANSTGHIVTCYGNLPAGTMAKIQILSGGDMSYGISDGTNWVSSAQGSLQTPMPLPFTVPAVPAGYIIEVIQTGV